MNLSTIIAVLALAAIVGAALRHIYKTRQNGGCCCSSGCSSCSSCSLCSSCGDRGCSSGGGISRAGGHSNAPVSRDKNSRQVVGLITADSDDADSRDTSIRQ